MNVFSHLIVFLVLSLGSLEMKKETEGMIEMETKYYCQCTSKLDKEVRKMTRKSKKLEKENQNKKYHSGDRIFGGSTLDFSYKDCLEERRSKIVARYIRNLTPSEKERFHKKVEVRANKKCPQKVDF